MLVLLPLLVVVPIIAADSDDKEIVRLIKQLGDDDFEASREEASKRLIAHRRTGLLDALNKATTER